MKKRRILLFILLAILIVGIGSLIALCLLKGRRAPNLQPVVPPEGAQLLQFPIHKGRITAGYGNAAYYAKNGYGHYGLDITVSYPGRGDVLASGTGIVLGTEFCDNSLGHIAVILYDAVYIPATGDVIPLVARYYHMLDIHIAVGDRVSAGEAIGVIDRTHTWYNHIHIEFDTDVAHPFNTPQVAETSSELLIRFPADGDGIIDPIGVLAVGPGQRVTAFPLTQSCTEKDEPRFSVGR